MNKRILLLAFSMLGISSLAHSQHNLKPNSLCKFVKKAKYWDYEGASSCNACAEDNKKNQAAVDMELKRRIAAGKIAEADKLRQIQQDYVKRNAEQKAKIEAQSKNVVSFAPPKTVIPTTPKSYNKTIVKPSSGVMYSLKRPEKIAYVLDNYAWLKHLVNERGDTILDVTKSQYYSVWGANKDKTDNFPEGIAMVLLSKQVSDDPFYRQPYRIYDIINNKGERLFNDDNILGLNHLWGNYFFIGYGPATYYGGSTTDPIRFQKAGIYNIKDKSFYDFEKLSGYSYVVVDYALNECNYNIGRLRDECKRITEGAKAFIQCITSSNNNARTYTYYIINKNGAIEKQVITQ